MSITSDIRSYADTAIEQAQKQVLSVVGTAQTTVEQAQKQAQQQFNDVTESANEFVGKLAGSAKDNVTSFSGKAGDLRSQAEKALYIDSLKSAVEPYLEQAKSYRHTISSTLTDRAETVYNTVKSDPRVAKVIDSAENVSTFVIGTVNERLVKPALSLTGRTTSTAKKPAATRPATKKSTTSKTPAAKTTARKAPAKKATAAKTAPARKTTAATTTAKTTAAKTTTAAKKTTARKAPAKKATS